MILKSYFSLCMCVVTFSASNLACAQMKKKTMRQIQSLENEKNARTKIQQKIESHLLQAVKEARGEKTAASVPLQPADLDIDANGLVNVDIAAAVTDSLLQNIKNLGGVITYPSKEYHTIRAKVPISKVEIIAGYIAVKFIGPAAIAHNNRITPPIKP